MFNYDDFSRVSFDLIKNMTNIDPAKRPNIKDIIQSDDFFYFIADIKHSNQRIANLREELGPFKFGEAPLETGDLTF